MGKRTYTPYMIGISHPPYPLVEKFKKHEAFFFDLKFLF
jgi:hypothetical protein